MRLSIGPFAVTLFALAACGGATQGDGATGQSEEAAQSSAGVTRDGGCGAACSDTGVIVLDGGGPPADGGGQPGDGGRGVDGGPLPSSYTAAQLEAARQACDAPHGSADPYHTPEELVRRAVAPWYLCKPPSYPVIPGGGSAIYEPDGSWLALRPDGAGGLHVDWTLRTTGVFTPINLDDASVTCDAGCILQITNNKGGLSQFQVSFEKGPRRMSLGDNWLVPLE